MEARIKWPAINGFHRVCFYTRKYVELFHPTSNWFLGPTLWDTLQGSHRSPPAGPLKMPPPHRPRFATWSAPWQTNALPLNASCSSLRKSGQGVRRMVEVIERAKGFGLKRCFFVFIPIWGGRFPVCIS